MNRIVKRDRLASILLFDKSYEEYAEPFRKNQSDKFIVTFEEYVGFIDEYLDRRNFLHDSTLVLKYWLEKNDTINLLKAFYRDMACAVMKDAWYITRPTNLYHKVEGGLEIPLDAFKSDYTKTLKELIKLADSRGYAYPKEKLKQLESTFKYASILYGMGKYGIEFCQWSRKE